MGHYREVMGYNDEWTWANESGDPTDGGIRRDDLRLLFGDDPAFVAVITSYPKSRLPLLLFVEIIEAIYMEYTDKGVPIADPLRVHPYGPKEFAFVEGNGYYVMVAEEVG